MRLYRSQDSSSSFNTITGDIFDNDEAYAYAYSHGDQGRGMIWAGAEAAVVGGSTSIIGYSNNRAEVLATSCDGVHCDYPAGSWATYGIAWAEISGSGPYSFTVSSEVGFLAPPTLRRAYVRADTASGAPNPTASVISVWGVDNYVLLDGFTYDSNNEVYEGSINLSGSDLGSILLTQGEFDDAEMDVDGDGRFNADDSAALYAQLGSTSSEFIPRLDFDESGDVSQADVDALDDLIAVGLDSGLVGDYTGDGVADCSDLSAMGSGWSYTLGDSNYRVEIDVDLDGDNDAADYSVVYDLLQPADMDDDGDVDTQDTLAYLNLWNASDPEADLNGDALVNTQDWLPFLNLWNDPC